MQDDAAHGFEVHRRVGEQSVPISRPLDCTQSHDSEAIYPCLRGQLQRWIRVSSGIHQQQRCDVCRGSVQLQWGWQLHPMPLPHPVLQPYLA